MHISELRIRNFRNFRSAKLQFRKGVNTLIGENGSGKTNALYALRLLIDESLPRNATSFEETDFCRELGARWKGHWIVISADFENLDPSEGCQLIKHFVGHMDETERGTLTLFFRPKHEIRKELSELTDQEFEDRRDALTVDDYEYVFTGRGTGNFCDDEIYTQYAYDSENQYYASPDEDDQNVYGVRTNALHQDVACTFVRALRDVVSELRGYRGNPLLSLLRGMETEIEIDEAEQIEEQVEQLNDSISGLDEIEHLARGIETALERAIGNTYSPTIRIDSALPASIEKLLQRLNVLVGDTSGSAYRGQIQEQSLGSANLIYLAMKLLEYENKLSSDRVAHFLLIEEPESHIHTHIQKSLFSNLPSGSTQVFVTTHSTHISSVAQIASVNVLAAKGDNAEIYQPSNGLDTQTMIRLERYLDAVRSTLLFAKGVVLVEGDAEQILIPTLVEKVFGLTPDEMGFSLVSMSSAFFESVSVIFDNDRIRRPCSIVTDLDTSVLNLPDDKSDDTSAQAHARASEEAGEKRAAKLEEQTGRNPWVNTFFATYTFEVDLLVEAENEMEITQTLDHIYRRSNNVDRSRNRLESDDISISGTEVLRLANKVGKGWFALLISEHITSESIIPNYILEAVAFACHQGLTQESLRTMCFYRLDSHEPRSEAIDPEELEDIGTDDFLELFIERLPEDPLSEFIQYLQSY